MADASAIGTEFVKFYYATFDAGRAGLAGLYKPQSMLTFEGQPFQGTEAIIGKLTSLPFQKVQHKVTTVDCQPSVSNGIVISVTGQLLVSHLVCN
jgi:hypothetical protein